MASHLGTPLAQPLSARDHIRGPRSAVVSLVEYGDFECPYCRAAADIVNGLRHALGDQLSFTFRHFPMDAAHPHAQHAAEVAEAAAAQGRFWEMHDRLFADQSALDDDALLRHAHALALETGRVAQELGNGTHAARVAADRAAALESGVTSTPTFFIDGLRYDGSVSLPRLLAAIRVRHPDLRVAEEVPSTPRIPRIRWPRDEAH